MDWILENFAQPRYLWFLLIIPLLLLWYYFKNRKMHAEIVFSGFRGLKTATAGFKKYFVYAQYFFRLLAIIALIFALARPFTSDSGKNINVEGIDIMLAIDVSGSMLARDLLPNRIEAAKDVAAEFIEKRPNDRIGLIAYSGVAFTQCPLTSDHSILSVLLSRISNNMIADGTAIGDGLGLAVERLRNSDAVSKVVVLLTDGINNMGFIDPMTAAVMAKEFNVRVYTVGVGTRGKAPYPVMTPFGTKLEMVDVEIDEALLEQIALMTGGKYFRAVDNKSLAAIYTEIDQLEKTKIEVAHFTNTKELFYIPLLFALGFLFLEILIKYLIVKSLP